MNKDTSTFSLQQADTIIQERIDAMSFKPFSFYMNDETISVENVNRRLRYFEGNMTVPYGFSEDTRVLIIPVNTDIYRDAAEKIFRIRIVRLILCQSSHGDQNGRTGHWYFQEVWFEQSTTGVDTFFNSSSIVIRKIPRDDKKFYEMIKPQKDFGITFWKTIEAWSTEVISKREALNRHAKRLKAEAIEAIIIARRLLPINP